VEQGALEALGYSDCADVKIKNVVIIPQISRMGSSVQTSFELVS
jgi:hypothetical protein